MNFSRRLLLIVFRAVTGAIFRIHDAEIARVPAQGPLILVINHINIMEIPILITRLQPRPVTGLVLAERWKNPLLAWVLNTFQAIPLERKGINLSSVRHALDELSSGKILAIMPEGTRSGDGRLQKGYPGVVLLAIKSGAPLLPVVTHGGEKYKDNLSHLRRTDFYISVGEPFTLTTAQAASRHDRQHMLDEIMQRMAVLLPPEYRGEYSEAGKADQ